LKKKSIISLREGMVLRGKKGEEEKRKKKRFPKLFNLSF
jgi:hypothetical protein